MNHRGKVRRTLHAGIALAALAAAIVPAWAAPARSGGYSRPSITRSAPRTPSVSTFSPSRSSSPSSGSGGYFRPRDRTPPVLSPSTSAGDLAIGRRNSGQALDSLRRRQADEREATERASRPSRPSWYEGDRTPDLPSRRRRREVDDSPGFEWPTPAPRRRGNDYGYARDDGYSNGYAPRRTPPVRPRWSADPSWSAPSWVNTRVNSGNWNPLLLWYLLDTLSRPGHAEWFRQHRDDPGYASWRRSADASAASQPELQGKLSELDRSLGAALERPSDPAYLPSGISKADATVQESGGFGGFIFVFVLFAALGFGGFWIFRRLKRRNDGMRSPGIGDVAAAAASAVRSKAGVSEPPRRDPFRLGQVVRIDQTGFILGEDVLKSPMPKEASATVTGVGRLDNAPLTRLHLSGDRFLQVHVSDAGRIDECRLFQPIDRVLPASADDWLFWIPPGLPSAEAGAPNEWAIGFPVFEDKDGVRWDRVWMPGEATVDPVEATETITTAAGTATRTISMMLYARDTGAAPPAPSREYLLLSSVREGADASILIHVGIDVGSSSLQTA
jgi:hypothetical protein